jgi:hypothetical protein
MNQFDPYVQQPQNQPPAPRVPPKKSRHWPWVLLALVALIVVISVANNSSGSKPGATTAPTAAAAPAGQSTTAAPEAPVAPTGPLTVVSDGTYEVGVDMVAGKYKGQCGTNSYWARLKSDNSTDYITNDWKPDGGLMQFTTKKGEYVEVKNCTFTRQG